MAKMYVQPIMYDDGHGEYTPIADGQYVDVSRLPVSSAVENVLTTDDDGLCVTVSGCISAGAGNALVEQDGRLFVPVVVAVSKDTGNLVVSGSDGGAYLDSGELLSDKDINLIITDEDGKLLLSEESLSVRCVSDDEGNAIFPGRDNKAYFPSDWGTM